MSDEMAYHEAAAVQSPFCGALRSKKYFMLSRLATEAGDYLDGSNHCWCRVTQQVVGPDGNQARPERCGPDRSCYQSAI
jgi:hypothetical protein